MPGMMEEYFYPEIDLTWLHDRESHSVEYLVRPEFSKNSSFPLALTYAVV